MTFINKIALKLIARYESVKADREDGASMAEYGLLLALIAVVAAAGATMVGDNANSLFEDVAGKLTS